LNNILDPHDSRAIGPSGKCLVELTIGRNHFTINRLGQSEKETIVQMLMSRKGQSIAPVKESFIGMVVKRELPELLEYDINFVFREFVAADFLARMLPTSKRIEVGT
jgi:hypothetical protein